MVTLYSCIAGVYVFDEKNALVEHLAFENSDLHKVNAAFESGEWLGEERQLIAKHGKGRVLFLGFKKERLEGVVFSSDVSKLEAFSGQLDLEALHSVSLLVAKRKLKLSVGLDSLVIQCSDCIEELNRAASLVAKRLREWYGLYNPEFSRSVADHGKFAELIISKSRAELLSEIGLDGSSGMGADLRPEDVAAVAALAAQLKSLYALRESQKEYLDILMQELCPNLRAVAGSLIGARLIVLAGSLRRLSELPASTVQVLGAERALFRHLKTGAKAPKFGVIFSHPLIQESDRKLHGKVGRTLSDKIAIAAKLDYFKGDFIGDRLRGGLDARFKK